MTQRKVSSKLLLLQRNLELMELTNAFLLSLAFAFLSYVVEETAKRRQNLRHWKGEHCPVTCLYPYSNKGRQASDSSLHFLYAL